MKIYENLWKSMKIYENLWKSMEIYGNLCKSMKIYENLWKSMKIYGMHNIYGIYLFWKKKMGYIFYILNTETPHISVLQREINYLNRENGNRVFRENMDFDLQNTRQSHYFDENVKWSYGHYGHFAPAGFPQNHNKTCVFLKHVEIHFLLDYWGVNRLKPEYYWGGLTPPSTTTGGG